MRVFINNTSTTLETLDGVTVSDHFTEEINGGAADEHDLKTGELGLPHAKALIRG